MQRRHGNSACDIGPSRRGCARPSPWRCTRTDEFGWGGLVERIEVTLRDIDAALPVVREGAIRTPTAPFHNPEGPEVWLKRERALPVGAFCPRLIPVVNTFPLFSGIRRGVATI